MNTIYQGNNPQNVNTGEETPVTVKRIVTERPSLNNSLALPTELWNNPSMMEIKHTVTLYISLLQTLIY